MSQALAVVAANASEALVGAALLAGLMALAVTRRPALALGVFLDFLLAAGLLRLIGAPDWRTITTAAVIIAIRHMVGYGLRLGARSLSASGSPASGPGPAA